MKLLFILLSISPFLTFCSAAGNDTEKLVIIYHSSDTGSVAVAGSFNNWSPVNNPMSYDGKGTWKVEIDLQPGYYQYKIVVDGKWIPDPGNDWKINDGGDNFNSIVKVGDPPVPQRQKRNIPMPKEKLPEPVLESEPGFIELYYAAWQMAWNKIKEGTPENGFVPFYMDEGFNELIYQWDTGFIASFGIYGRKIFPAMPSLDNFYLKQRADGYIQRVYWEKDGSIAQEPAPEEPMVNPPLFAWIEWRYYKISGDTSRLSRVLPVLIKYYNWIEKNCSSEKSRGLFYVSPLGSGMDNIPRKNVNQSAYIDFSAQQALAALYISRIAEAAGKKEVEDEFSGKYSLIKNRINEVLWDEHSKFYFDLAEDGSLSPTMHIGAFWTLLSGVCPPEKLPYLVSHLKDTSEFRRPHLIPALAANQPEYDIKGHYWLGSVWAPTNYMVIKGLMSNNQFSLADSIAFNHLHNILNVYNNFKPVTDKLAFEERYNDDYKTLWECYSSELQEPATRWDNTFYSRQDFVGWTGLAPIALLIENILGFDINGKDNTISWTIKHSCKNGIKNIQLAGQDVSLIFEIKNGKPNVYVKCEKQFRLKIVYNNKEYLYDISQPESTITM